MTRRWDRADWALFLGLVAVAGIALATARCIVGWF